VTGVRKTRLGVPVLLGLFAGGGYESFRSAPQRANCRLPPRLLPWSAQRIWAGVQFSGNPRAPVFFSRGKDVVIPQMLLLKGGGSHADQPSCETMAASSPLSAAFERTPLHTNRSTLLWFGVRAATFTTSHTPPSLPPPLPDGEPPLRVSRVAGPLGARRRAHGALQIT
jgi:hypothetical protein